MNLPKHWPLDPHVQNGAPASAGALCLWSPVRAGPQKSGHGWTPCMKSTALPYDWRHSRVMLNLLPG
jgi:hypothetical protein